jgi:signal transduction histidine kinase
MNEPTDVTLESNVRFVVNGSLNNANRSGCKDRKNIMMRGYAFSLSEDRTVAFCEHQAQMQFCVPNPDGATLELIAQQTERKRIAQELHDTLLQGFTSVALKLDALTNSLPAELSKTKEQLQKILEQTDEYLAEARRSIWNLRSQTSLLHV